MRVAFVVCFLGLSLLAGTAFAQPPRNPPAAPAKQDSSGTPETPSTIGGKTLAEWKAQLNHQDASKRSLAIIAILEFGKANQECVPQIISLTYDKDLSPKSKAIMALRYMEVPDKQVE